MAELNIQFPPILEQHISDIPPWIIPDEKICYNMEQFPKNTTPSTQTLSEFFYHKHNTHIDIYTDGSKSDCGVGSGIVYQSSCNRTSSRFSTSKKPQSSKASILTAELKAITYSLDYLSNLSNKTCTIYSDSKSSLQSIQQYDPKNVLVQDIKLKLTRAHTRSNEVTFCWVPAHTGIPGNEKADEQAKIASTTIASKHIAVPATDLYPHIHAQGKKWLQNQWDFFDNNKLHFIDPKIGEKTFHTFKSRREEIKYNRIRLGHTRFTNKYLAAGEDPPVCIICNRQVTVRHIFTNCPLYTEVRNRFFTGNNLVNILSRTPAENCSKVINFLKDINLYNEI